MINYLNKKFQRLLISKKVMKLFYFFHFLNGGFKSKKLNISFHDKKSRIEIVKNIIKLKQYKSYLEIGTFKDDLFSNIVCEDKIGVDPVSGGNVRKTSDEFFADNTKKFDLIFIDGLHHYDQVKKDILNSISILENNGIILMHDCMPRDYYYQAVPRSQFNWNGDTWKAFLEIRSNDNYDSYCCYADEGIGVILKRPNRNKLNFNIEKFKNFNFNLYVENYQKFLNLIEYEELIKIVKSYE
tara:strand:+ start:2264 stop:2986 length:723 start_codon:yes stop_codon:yes gene_type:complete